MWHAHLVRAVKLILTSEREFNLNKILHDRTKVSHELAKFAKLFFSPDRVHDQSIDCATQPILIQGKHKRNLKLTDFLLIIFLLLSTKVERARFRYSMYSDVFLAIYLKLKG